MSPQDVGALRRSSDPGTGIAARAAGAGVADSAPLQKVAVVAVASTVHSGTQTSPHLVTGPGRVRGAGVGAGFAEARDAGLGAVAEESRRHSPRSTEHGILPGWLVSQAEAGPKQEAL